MRASAVRLFRTTPSVAADRANTYAFVGLGQMGYHMLNNLITKTSASGQGEKSYVFVEPSSAAVQRFMQRKEKDYPHLDVKVVDTPADAIRVASHLVSMIPTSKDVARVYTANDSSSILAGLKSLSPDEIARTYCMDESTIEMSVSRNTSKALEAEGAHMVDAPVSGGVIGAEKATLTIMVGASSKDTFEKVKPTLETMGKKVLHCGDLGAGLAAKICNNMMLGISMLGLSEAMALGKRLGLDLQLLGDIINTSTGQSWASSTNFPVPEVTIGQSDPPAHREYKGGFLTKLQHKDLALAVDAAKDVDAPLIIGQLTEETFRKIAVDHPFADRDFSIMYKYIDEHVAKKK